MKLMAHIVESNLNKDGLYPLGNQRVLYCEKIDRLHD